MSQTINKPKPNLLRDDKIKALYVGWTDKRPQPDFPVWIPIYRMTWDNQGNFYYSYTHGFKNNLDRLKSKIVNPHCGFTQTWITPHIDPIINSRIPHRPDSMKQYDLLGLGYKKGDFIAYLSRSVGLSATDNYDIFPEVSPSALGYYHFYFPLLGLATLVKKGNKSVKYIADTIDTTQTLSLNFNSHQTFIYYQDLQLGYCPHYIHLLINSPLYKKHCLEIIRVNQEDYTYGARAILRLTISFDSNPFKQPEFQTLTFMPY